MTYDNNDGPVYSVLAGKPGTCCVKCTTIASYEAVPDNCTAGFTSVMIFEGYYRCERLVYTPLGCMDNPSSAYGDCYASGGTPSEQFSPCP